MSGFTDHLHEVFGAFGPIQTRCMFGGHGVWHQGLMIGLVAGDTLGSWKLQRYQIPQFVIADLIRNPEHMTAWMPDKSPA